MAFYSYDGTIFRAADNRSMDHQLYGANVVEKSGPGHRDLDRRPQGQHGFGGETDSAARYIHAPAYADFGQAISMEHLVFQLLLDGKTPLAPPFTSA